MLERDIQRACLDWLKLKGLYVWRQNQAAVPLAGGGFRRFNGLKGVSDILGILNDGRFLAIEVKNEKGKMSPEQDEFQQNIVDRGGVALCVHSLDELIEDMKELDLS